MLTNKSPTFAVLRGQSVPAMEARLGRTMDEASIRAMLDVHEDYLQRFHDTVRGMSGSLDAWLADTIGVDDALRGRLRAKFIA